MKDWEPVERLKQRSDIVSLTCFHDEASSTVLSPLASSVASSSNSSSKPPLHRCLSCLHAKQYRTISISFLLEGTKLLRYNLKVCIYNFIRINGFRSWNQQQCVGRKLLHFCVSCLYDIDNKCVCVCPYHCYQAML